MQRIASVFQALFCCALVAAASATSQAGMVVGTFGAPRVTTANLLTGAASEDAVAAMKAIVPGTSFAFASTLTPEFLSQLDLLVLGPAKAFPTDPFSGNATPLSASEQAALFNFVSAGGNALIFAETYFRLSDTTQSFIAPFGMTSKLSWDTGGAYGAFAQPNHPIANGPYGTATRYLMHEFGSILSIGPYATAVAKVTTLSGTPRNDPALAVIEAGAISPTSGRVVVYSDSNAFRDSGPEHGLYDLAESQIVWANTIAYLAPVPEPSTFALSSMALVGLLVIKARRRREGAVVREQGRHNFRR